MATGRNDLCPCGSGKKYKKCCLNERNMAAGNSLQPQDSRVKPQEYLDELEKQEFMLRAINNMRSFVLDKKPHIKDYYKIRNMHSEILDGMIKYYDDGKFEQKPDTDNKLQTDDNTLYLIDSEFDFDTTTGMQGFCEIMIYKSAPNMSCITEDFINKHRYRKAEKIEFLHSMLDSKLGLFEITGTDADEGYVFLKEVFTGTEYKIIDVGLSGNKYYDEAYIYTRIINYHGISFGTGLNFLFDKNDNFIKDHIKHHKKNYSPNGEFLRFTQLYNRYTKYPNKFRVITNTIE